MALGGRDQRALLAMNRLDLNRVCICFVSLASLWIQTDVIQHIIFVFHLFQALFFTSQEVLGIPEQRP